MTSKQKARSLLKIVTYSMKTFNNLDVGWMKIVLSLYYIFYFIQYINH